MKKLSILCTLTLGLLSTNLQGQIQTFEMNESGNTFELGFNNFGIELGGTYFLKNGPWGIKYHLGGLPYWKNSFKFYNYSESDAVREFEYPDGPWTYYDTYYSYHENYIQSSWVGLGLTYRYVVNEKLSILPSIEYQAVNEIYATGGNGELQSSGGSWTYEDFMQYEESSVYYYARAGLAIGYNQFVFGAVYTPWDLPLQTPVMLRIGYSFKKSNTLDFN